MLPFWIMRLFIGFLSPNFWVFDMHTTHTDMTRIDGNPSSDKYRHPKEICKSKESKNCHFSKCNRIKHLN